jgi:hypothetical protein
MSIEDGIDETEIRNHLIISLLSLCYIKKNRNPSSIYIHSVIGKSFNILPLIDSTYGYSTGVNVLSNSYIISGYTNLLILDSIIGEQIQETCKVVYFARCIERLQEWDLIIFIITKQGTLYYLPLSRSAAQSITDWNLKSISEFSPDRIAKIIGMLNTYQASQYTTDSDGRKMILQSSIMNNHCLTGLIEGESLTPIATNQLLKGLYLNV